MPRNPAFRAWYTRSAVLSFFHAVPYTSLGIMVLEAFLRVVGEDKADEAVAMLLPTLSLVDSVPFGRPANSSSNKGSSLCTANFGRVVNVAIKLCAGPEVDRHVPPRPIITPNPAFNDIGVWPITPLLTKYYI
jgi:hypothetical protein